MAAGGRSVTPPALSAEVRVARGTFVVDVRIELRRGEVLALLGPNGAGKSTLLAVIAGLLMPGAGRVHAGGRELTRVQAGRRPAVHVPPSARGIGLLGQDPQLFPHLTALQNVAFGPRAQRHPMRVASADAAAWLERVGLAGLGERRPAELSGGQQRRVAIARALAARPSVLLLDEPFASLDVETAPDIRELLREQLRSSPTTAIVVSHDALDAVVLADRTAVIADGRIVDEGPTARVFAEPRDLFTAAVAGVNLVTGSADGGAVVAAGGIRFTGRGGHRDEGAMIRISGGAPAAAVFRPASVVVSTRQPEGVSSRNVWRARVNGMEHAAGGIRVRTGPLPVVADLMPASVAELGLAEGSEVWLSVKASEVSLYRR
ncbi:sulfate/molybdate ABC transporter ATP-binding protein [Luethyella okanaganae]|uniref:Sulfate/molybdate ABC transporter ATP-binding protein n=1 Tax=Luethyella okanaganae TaxID=69372 RepID=A0ABW1V9B0_9MICO